MSEITIAAKSNGTGNRLAEGPLPQEGLQKFNDGSKNKNGRSARQPSATGETATDILLECEDRTPIKDSEKATHQPCDVLAKDPPPPTKPDEGSLQTVAIDLTPEKLIELAQNAGTEFFHDQHGDAFAWISTTGKAGVFECLKIKSQAFKARLLDLAEAVALNSPQPSTITQAIELALLKAFRAPTRELANRHKTDGKHNFIDLGDNKWSMVAVSRESWSVRPQDEPRFFRTQHQLAMTEPVPGGDPFELFQYVPVDTEEEKLLVLAWTIGAFFSDAPHPMLLFIGPQGSAKTTRSRRLRTILDPSVTPVLGDIELSNLFLTFQNHAVPCFENVSKFSRREADMFCRAVTGNGVERRKMFTDSEQVIYSFRRPIIINGIDTPSTRPDFLDRCVIVNCRRMTQFKTLHELDRLFEEARPRLFGSLLDLLVKTLNQLESGSTTGEFRMADFARVGRAMAAALGQSPGSFDAAYSLNNRHQDLEILESTPMARAVTKLAAAYTVEKAWEGTAEELLRLLRDVAYRNSDHDAKADIPKSPRWLSSRLSELVTALASEGVVIEKLPRTNSSRGWRLYSTTPWKPRTADEEFDDADIIDFMSTDDDPV